MDFDNMGRLYFDELKVRRGEDYFVTYRPPSPPLECANLSLVFLVSTQRSTVVAALEHELRIWLAKYPIPIMASAFDHEDSLIHLSDILFENSLVGWIDPVTKDVVTSWKLDELSAFTKLNPLPENLQAIYFDVPFRTEQKRKADIAKNVAQFRHNARAAKLLVVFWFVGVPAGVALLEYFGPQWLDTVVLIYALWRAYREWLKLLGRKKLTKGEIEENEKRSKMEHYYYHCERNQKGFLRLKLENFSEDARNRTKAEAAEIVDR